MKTAFNDLFMFPVAVVTSLSVVFNVDNKQSLVDPQPSLVNASTYVWDVS